MIVTIRGFRFFLVIFIVCLALNLTCDNTSSPTLSDVNFPVFYNSLNFFSFSLLAKTYSKELNETVTFQSKAVEIDLHVEDYEAGNCTIFIKDTNGQTVFWNYITKNMIIDNSLSLENPQSVIITLNDFSGKITLTCSKHSVKTSLKGVCW